MNVDEREERCADNDNGYDLFVADAFACFDVGLSAPRGVLYRFRRLAIQFAWQHRGAGRLELAAICSLAEIQSLRGGRGDANPALPL